MGSTHKVTIKNLPANAGDVRNLGSIPLREDPLEEEMAHHSSILARRIPWTEKPGSLQPMGLKKSDMTEHLSTKQRAHDGD